MASDQPNVIFDAKARQVLRDVADAWGPSGRAAGNLLTFGLMALGVWFLAKRLGRRS